MAKRNIAILGGGWGSITTALYLTHPDNPKRDAYDVTIYQLGWRLGGKAASGRGPYGRVQEHGLHVLMGAYENTFRLIRDTYAELDGYYPEVTGQAANPFKDWQDWFKPHSYVAVAEYREHQWGVWGFEFPTNDKLPGDAESVWLSPWDYVVMFLRWLVDAHGHSRASERPAEAGEREGIMGGLQALWDSVTEGIENAAHSVLTAALERFAGMADRDPSVLAAVAAAMDRFVIALLQDTRELVEWDDTMRRYVEAMELAAVTVKGLINDGVLENEEGLSALDEEDVRAWLHRHGASDAALDCPLVHGGYDLVFACEGGNPNRPNLAAGVAIQAMARMFLTYRGAIFWKMQAGMGDVMFAPAYLVLRQRGVKFRFFHNIEALHLDPEGRRVDSIDVGVQATLKDGRDDYWPLVQVRDLPCWPAEPNYDQLVQGEELKRRGIDLESFYTEWQPVERRTLRRGTDFDEVVLGIPVGALPHVAEELMQANPRFKAMVDNLATVRTMAIQFWMDRKLSDLGWERPKPVLASYNQPLNTWMDNSQFIPRETYPEGSVGSIASFTGPMAGDLDPADDHGAPARAEARVRQTGRIFMESLSAFMWPNAVPRSPEGYPLNPLGTAFDRLVAPNAEDREDAFERQYFGANISPWNRYVQSLAGTTKYRLAPDESGFDNVVLTGDWVRNGFNGGSIEPTTWSGMLAAHAVSGYPSPSAIFGFNVGAGRKFGEG